MVQRNSPEKVCRARVNSRSGMPVSGNSSQGASTVGMAFFGPFFDDIEAHDRGGALDVEVDAVLIHHDNAGSDGNGGEVDQHVHAFAGGKDEIVEGLRALEEAGVCADLYHGDLGLAAGDEILEGFVSQLSLSALIDELDVVKLGVRSVDEAEAVEACR